MQLIWTKNHLSPPLPYQLCEDLFEKINEDSNKEELSYSVEVSLKCFGSL